MALRSFNEWQQLNEGRRRNKMRSQKSATKMPETLSTTELQVRSANRAIHDMAGQGHNRTYGRAGSHDDTQTRSKDRENIRKGMKYGFDD